VSDRREFLSQALKSAASFALVAAVPAALIKQDEYDAFLDRIRSNVIKIVRREGRPMTEIVIEPPHYLSVHIDVANEGTTVTETPEGFRFVRVKLEGIPQPFTWNERL
jgi:hypothetical protein